MNAVALFERAAGTAEDAAYSWAGTLYAAELADRYGMTEDEWAALSTETRSALTFSTLHAEPEWEAALEDAERWTAGGYRLLARRLSLRLVAARVIAGEIPAPTVAPELLEPERLEVRHEREHAPPLTTRVSTCPRSPHGPPRGARYPNALGGSFLPLENGPPP